MILDFANGTDAQKDVVRDTYRRLLNFSLDPYSFTNTVSFDPDPSPSSDTEFAWTTTTDPAAVETVIRDDFPHFGGHEWNSREFAMETVAHELGHALMGQLPSSDLIRLRDMFVTDPSDWNDTNAAWEDRGLEGAAETFKDAFLPQRFRAYANRTNRKLPIWRYPEFRRIFRQPDQTGGGGGGSGYEYRSYPYTPPEPLDYEVYLGPGNPGEYVYFTDNEARQPDDSPSGAPYSGQMVYLPDGFPYRIADHLTIFPFTNPPDGYVLYESYEFMTGGEFTLHRYQLELHPVPAFTPPGLQDEPPNGEVIETGRQDGTRRNRQPITGSLR